MLGPTRKVSARLTVTYAGFEGESELLERLYKRGLQGEAIGTGLYSQPGLLMAWHHLPVAPWQTAEWIEQMRGQLRPNAFLRLIENKWVTSESTFADQMVGSMRRFRAHSGAHRSAIVGLGGRGCQREAGQHRDRRCDIRP